MSYKCFHGESPEHNRNLWPHYSQGKRVRIKSTATQHPIFFPQIYFEGRGGDKNSCNQAAKGYYDVNVLQVFSWWKPWAQQKSLASFITERTTPDEISTATQHPVIIIFKDLFCGWGGREGEIKIHVIKVLKHIMMLMPYKCFQGESPEHNRKTGIWHTGGNYPRWNLQAPNTWLNLLDVLQVFSWWKPCRTAERLAYVAVNMVITSEWQRLRNFNSTLSPLRECL